MTDFLWDTGTNGYTTSPFDILSSESGLSSLANGGSITSSVINSSGKFSGTDTGSAPLCDLTVTINGTVTPNAGGYIAIWFLRSRDGGSNFEAARATASTTVMALPRQPDAIVPLSNAAYSAGDLAWTVDVPLPPGTCKTILQNLSGQTLNINHVTMAPKALKY